jgi:hypothetical protein
MVMPVTQTVDAPGILGRPWFESSDATVSDALRSAAMSNPLIFSVHELYGEPASDSYGSSTPVKYGCGDE